MDRRKEPRSKRVPMPATARRRARSPMPRPRRLLCSPLVPEGRWRRNGGISRACLRYPEDLACLCFLLFLIDEEASCTI